MNQDARVIIGTIVVTVGLIIGAAYFMGGTPPTSESTKADPKLLVRENSNRTSTESAKVTLVEFGDFQCPACRQAHPVVKNIVETNKPNVVFVFRNFPLPQHPNAEIAAEAAEAAGAQGKYWAMYDKLYENQDVWADKESAPEIFATYAKELELDVEKFNNDVKDRKFADKINKDRNDGNTAGVNSTPTFFINGEKFQGNDLKTAVDSALSANK